MRSGHCWSVLEASLKKANFAFPHSMNCGQRQALINGPLLQFFCRLASWWCFANWNSSASRSQAKNVEKKWPTDNWRHKQTFHQCSHAIQSWPKKFVLGCVISPLRQQAESRNLWRTFLANSVFPSNWTLILYASHCYFGEVLYKCIPRRKILW